MHENIKGYVTGSYHRLPFVAHHTREYGCLYVLNPARLHASDKARSELGQKYACCKKLYSCLLLYSEKEGKRNFIVAKCEGRI